ncbi:MAG: hypothetical protein MHM6MM_008346, partial [Cercozoa sp. M6MM]
MSLCRAPTRAGILVCRALYREYGSEMIDVYDGVLAFMLRRKPSLTEDASEARFYRHVSLWLQNRQSRALQCLIDATDGDTADGATETETDGAHVHVFLRCLDERMQRALAQKQSTGVPRFSMARFGGFGGFSSAASVASAPTTTLRRTATSLQQESGYATCAESLSAQEWRHVLARAARVATESLLSVSATSALCVACTLVGDDNDRVDRALFARVAQSVLAHRDYSCDDLASLEALFVSLDTSQVRERLAHVAAMRGRFLQSVRAALALSDSSLVHAQMRVLSEGVAAFLEQTQHCALHSHAVHDMRVRVGDDLRHGRAPRESLPEATLRFARVMLRHAPAVACTEQKEYMAAAAVATFFGAFWRRPRGYTALAVLVEGESPLSLESVGAALDAIDGEHVATDSGASSGISGSGISSSGISSGTAVDPDGVDGGDGLIGEMTQLARTVFGVMLLRRFARRFSRQLARRADLLRGVGTLTHALLDWRDRHVDGLQLRLDAATVALLAEQRRPFCESLESVLRPLSTPTSVLPRAAHHLMESLGATAMLQLLHRQLRCFVPRVLAMPASVAYYPARQVYACARVKNDLLFRVIVDATDWGLACVAAKNGVREIFVEAALQFRPRSDEQGVKLADSDMDSWEGVLHRYDAQRSEMRRRSFSSAAR